MCGIAGAFDLTGSGRSCDSLVQSMCHKLSHRGPDDQKVLSVGNLTVGFARLSILDLEQGMQPMFNETGSIVSVCNGEVFNHVEIAKLLKGRGHQLRTRSDCEVIPHLYEEVSDLTPLKLNGQFAFAIYDRPRESMFLARDHFGITPLFYTLADDYFLFASEIKALLQHPMVSRECNLSALDQVFNFPGLVSPATMFKDIHSVPPGHSLRIAIHTAEPVIHQYWDLVYPSEQPLLPRKPINAIVDELLELLGKSIHRRLGADVPVGLYLSGGLDSSLIGALAQSISPQVRHSFSIDFLERELSEGRYQQLISYKLGSIHHPTLIEGEDIAMNLKKVIYHCECPLKEMFNVAAVMLSGSVKESGLKVVLGGQGADELFGGYIGYRFDQFHSSGHQPRPTSSEAERRVNESVWGLDSFIYERPLLKQRLEVGNLYSAHVLDSLNTAGSYPLPSFQKRRISSVHPFHRRSYVDMKLRLADHLLGDHGDRMSFANGIEGRFPFLDQELVEYVRQIPVDYMIGGAEEKPLLRRMARGLVPDPIIDREKFGFAAPGSPYLLREKIEFVNDILSPQQIRKDGYFDAPAIEALSKKYRSDGFRINVPFESDFLAVVLTFGIFRDIFKLPQLA